MAAKTNRLLWSAALCICLGWVALGAGTSIGALYVPKGSGLAGPAIALGYGVVAAAVAVLVGVLIGWKGSPGALRGATYASLVLAIIAAGLTVRRVLGMRAARRAELGLDEPLPPARAFRLHAVAPATERTNRSFRELDVDGSDWTVHWIAVGPEAARCSASLIGEEAEGLTQALDQISEAFDGDPDLCAEATGPDPVRVDFRGDRSWTLDLTGKCMIEHEPVKDLSKRLFRLPIDAVSRGEASCD